MTQHAVRLHPYARWAGRMRLQRPEVTEEVAKILRRLENGHQKIRRRRHRLIRQLGTR
jgi:hypothetical protein